MLAGKFGAMVLDVTLWAEIRLFNDTVKFSQLWRDFATILAVWRFGDHFLVRINREIDQIHRENLVVFVYDVLMFVQLDVFLLVIQVNRLEALGQGDNFIHELFDWAAVRFANCNLVEDKTELVFCSERTA